MSDPAGPAPLISVVVPTYDRAHLLPRLLDSLEREIGPHAHDVEVIIADDGSTDGTAALIERRNADWVRFVEQDHLGANAARNLGAGVARGRYLIFVDSDDEVLPGWARFFVSAAADGTAAVATASTEIVFADGRTETRRPIHHYRAPQRINWRPGCMMIRTTLFGQAGGYDLELRSAQHEGLWLRILPLLDHDDPSQLAVSDEVVMRYNSGTPGSIRASSSARLLGTERLLSEHYESAVPAEFRHRLRAVWHDMAAYAASECGEPRRARMHARAAFREDADVKRASRIGLLLVPPAVRRRLGLPWSPAAS